MSKFNSFFIGFFTFGIFSAIDTHIKLNKLKKDIDEYFTNRYTNKRLIEQRSASNAIFRVDKKRSNECIAIKSK